MEQSLKNNKQSPDMLKSAKCRYSVKVLHVKSFSPCAKDVVLYFLYLILMYCGLLVCDASERGIEGAHSKFYYK